MEYFAKTRKVGSSVIVTVPKSTNIKEDTNVKIDIKEIKDDGDV
jgi:hypothetical protein